MGAIQNQINQTLGQASIAAGVGKHAAAEAKQAKIAEAKNQAEIAATQEQLNAAKLAYKNDTIEASIAIRSHESGFDPEIKGKKMSEYVKVDKEGNPILDKNGKTIADPDALTEALNSLDEKEINMLADKVHEYRSGKMREDRIARMTNAKKVSEEELKDLQKLDKKARAAADPLSSQGKWGRNVVYQEKTGGFTRAQMAKKIREAKGAGSKYMKKAYESFRELNDRLAASSELKFDIKAATEKINILGGKK